MGNTLYLECNAGISGDMTVAALLDLGASEDVLKNVLATVPATGFQIEIGRVKKAGVDCCDFRVILDEEHENHDHDMEYLHGHTVPHEQDHEHHKHEHHHEHEKEYWHEHENKYHHEHEQGNEHHHHAHRGMPEIRQILTACHMTDKARSLANRIFDILAQAESKAHRVPVDEVHFHEVGAIDSIVDIISVAVCMDNLAITDVIVPRLCEGTGTVRCQHGILSIPVPAVANILTSYDLKVELMDISGEFITPTGAAIVAAVKTSDKLPKEFKIKKIGMGAGKRNYERASILRAMLIEPQTAEKDSIYKLESNIDDCSGEALGFVMERLFQAGARDVYYMPVFMKKNRPAWMLNVICREEDIKKLEQIIFFHTTTIGIRRVEMERTCLKREIKQIQSEFGEVSIKVCDIDGEKRYYPEYESVARICREQNMSYGEVYQLLVHQCVE